MDIVYITSLLRLYPNNSIFTNCTHVEIESYPVDSKNFLTDDEVIWNTFGLDYRKIGSRRIVVSISKPGIYRILAYTVNDLNIKIVGVCTVEKIDEEPKLPISLSESKELIIPSTIDQDQEVFQSTIRETSLATRKHQQSDNDMKKTLGKMGDPVVNIDSYIKSLFGLYAYWTIDAISSISRENFITTLCTFVFYFFVTILLYIAQNRLSQGPLTSWIKAFIGRRVEDIRMTLERKR